MAPIVSRRGSRKWQRTGQLRPPTR